MYSEGNLCKLLANIIIRDGKRNKTLIYQE